MIGRISQNGADEELFPGKTVPCRGRRGIRSLRDTREVYGIFSAGRGNKGLNEEGSFIHMKAALVYTSTTPELIELVEREVRKNIGEEAELLSRRIRRYWLW